MSKRILYQSDHELLALEVKTTIKQVKIKDEAEFNEYLSKDLKTPIYWLLDTVKEEYQMATLPHVVGKDRNDLIRHRKKRLFQDTSYSHAVLQDREKEGRKDDRILFIALSNPEILQPWLKLIVAHKVPLVGIYSVPLLSQQLLNFLPKTAYTLLITDNSPTTPASIRQSFFRNQKLQLSRLIPLHANATEPQEYANYVLRQITTTQHYLENNRLLPEVGALSIIILTTTDKCKACETLNANNLNIHFEDSQKLANKLKLQKPLIAALFARNSRVKNHYAKAADRLYMFHRRGRIIMYSIAALILIGTIMAGGLIVQDTIKIKQKGEKFLNQANNLEEKIKTLRLTELPDLPFRSELIVSVVDVGLRLQAKHISPQATWKKLSTVFNLHHKLVLKKLEWEVANSPSEIFKSTPTLEDESTDDFQPKKYFIEGVRLHGEVSNFKSYKDALVIFKKFVRDLSRYWKIEVLQQPYDPKDKLHGGSEKIKAPFIIQILITHSYPHETD
ncbi:hypothetical protein QUF74_14095 [Candidatus Halobeggiatoa sp. HSG11]|nr:hypothetical protein [Candidatus Halobeggiatoa sp. HSG11]